MWTFTNSSNPKMTGFIGKEGTFATPRRKDDGHRVGFFYEPGKPENWYFQTSTVVSVNKIAHIEEGYATLEVRTHNSTYWFYKKLQ